MVAVAAYWSRILCRSHHHGQASECKFQFRGLDCTARGLDWLHSLLDCRSDAVREMALGCGQGSRKMSQVLINAVTGKVKYWEPSYR